MNLSEMSKKKGVLPAETTQQMPILHDTIDKWRKLLQEQAEALSKVNTERDRLLEIQRKDQENIQKCLERMRELRENLQKLSSENQKLQDELQKLTEENQKLQTELSRTQNINLSLQRSNDDLRNRNGLLSRKEQEQLEEKIRDVQDRNSKLEKMVVQSSVEAVEEALKKQQEAEKRMCSLELLIKMERRDAACQLDKTKRQMKKIIMETEKKKNLWCLGLFFLSLLSVMRNEVMLNDLSEVVMFPVWFWKEITKFADWLFYPQNENFSFNGNNIEFSSGAAWIVRFLCVAIAIVAVLLVVWIICGFCREYKKHWNEYEMYLVVVVFAVMAVIGDVFSRYIHINLLLMTVGVISLQFIIRKRNVLGNVK